MALSIERRDTEAVNSVKLALEGELDVASSSALRDELTRDIEAGARHLVLDMTQVVYMDSSGLGAMVTAHRTLGSKGSISLVGCRPNVERVLRFTQFDKVLNIYRTMEDLEAGNRDNLRAVSGVSKSVMMKQKSMPRVGARASAPSSEKPGRRLQ